MASSTLIKLACAVIVCMVVGAPYANAAISCGTVSNNIAKCLTYLKGGAGPSTACCTGVTTLNNMATTPADRKTACGCLKSAASSIKGINNQRASDLPAKCGVTISYSISPNTDCSKVN